MNNKGFTLVEMLAVIVILAILGGIATNGVLSYIDTSKKKSEKIFIDQLEEYIKSYVNLYGSTISKTENSYTFKKCKRSTDLESDCPDKKAYVLTPFPILTITSAEIKLVETENLINPSNKKQCFSDTKNPLVKLFKDEDFVYYYYVDLSSNNCELNSDNRIITNIPEKLCKEIKAQDKEGAIEC